jgi:hypothetical protein
MPAVKLLGFAPDRPPTEPGVMVNCTNIVPTEDGFAVGPSTAAVPGLGALAAACRGGVVATKADGSRRTIAGTQTRLYELTAGAWADVSRGLAYTGSTENRWSFAQFGNVTLASNGTQIIQASTSGAFADVTGAPAAKVIFAVGDFTMALGTNEGTYGDQGDRWWCSGIFNHTTWAPSITTQANSGQLVGGGGNFTAGLALGEVAVAYKARGMWRGTYVGGAVTWQWDQIEGEQGAVGQEAVCDADGLHVFVGDDNIWVYDGVRAVPIGNKDVRQWFFTNSSPSYRYRTILSYERQNNRVWIFFPNAGSTDGTPDRALVFHMGTGRWGRADRSIQAAFGFVQPGVTFDTLNTVAATFNALPASFDSQYWLAGGRSLAVIDTSNTLQTLTGTPVSGTFVTGDIGDDWLASRLSVARLRFMVAPTSASVTGVTLTNTGGTPVGGGAASLYNGAFYVRQAGRWHRLAFTLNGPAQFELLDHDLTPDGAR